MTDHHSLDVIIVGAGMAGASLAYFLSPTHKVAIIERERHAGYHATGRSAALFSEVYGTPLIRRLSEASRAFLRSPPAGFSEAPILSRRGALFISSAQERVDMAHFIEGLASSSRAGELHVEDAISRVPVLRRGYLDQAILEPDAADIDVDLLLQSFLKQARANNVQFLFDLAISEIAFGADCWTVRGGGEILRAPVLVNAAGAWADELAMLAGVPQVGLTPRLRNAATIDGPPGASLNSWPMVFDVAERFYFKPDAGKLLVSPADATPTSPCDAYSDDLQIATAIDRIQQAADIEVRRVNHSWAGLRTFAPDQAPVVGFDPAAPGFFWLAAQGGYGIQTAPALGALAASLITQTTLPEAFAVVEQHGPTVSPARFRPGALGVAGVMS